MRQQCETVGLAPEGAQLMESGFSIEVVETIFQSRASSTRRLYAVGECQLNPVYCPVGTVLDYLQECFSAGLSPSTLKVYVATISAYFTPLGGASLGRDPLTTHFLCGTMRLRPTLLIRAPAWD